TRLDFRGRAVRRFAPDGSSSTHQVNLEGSVKAGSGRRGVAENDGGFPVWWTGLVMQFVDCSCSVSGFVRTGLGRGSRALSGGGSGCRTFRCSRRRRSGARGGWARVGG